MTMEVRCYTVMVEVTSKDRNNGDDNDKTGGGNGAYGDDNGEQR